MWCGRILATLLLLLVVAVVGLWYFLRGSLPQLDGSHATPGLGATVTVTRDAHGVPAISGADRLDVAYATGFVHAQDRFFQMDLLRRAASGELAELFGARAVALDRAHRLHRFRARADLAVQALPAADRLLLERYSAGVNDGLNSLTSRPFEYALVGMMPRPWTPADSLLVIWTMYADLQGGIEARELARGWLKEHATAQQLAFLLPASTQWDAPLDADKVAAPDTPIPATPPAWWGKPRVAGTAAAAAAAAAAAIAVGADTRFAGVDYGGYSPGAADLLSDVGSNNWALSGSRSQSGAAIVSDDMHLGLQLPNIWYRLVLQFPQAGGTRRMVGVTLPGAPVVVAGSNGHVAWGFTNSYGDYLDLIVAGADPAKPGQVRTPAGWETPVAHAETIAVKGGAPVAMTVRETSMGPLREAGGRTYIVHWAGHEAGAVNINLRKMESIDTLADTLAAAGSFGIPQQNLIAGDDRGDIGWTTAGPLPRRVPGSAEAASFPLAADDPAAVWHGWLTLAESPRVENPPGGQLSTANSRQLMGAGAALLGDGGFDLGARAHQVRDDLRLLGVRTDVKSVYGVTLDDRAVFMTEWRDRAIVALGDPVVSGHPQRAEFLQLLKTGWSGRASVDSAGYRLARGFEYALYDLLFDGANGELSRLDPKASVAAATSRWPVVLGRLLDDKPAAWLPPQYASWQALQVAAIDRVIAELTSGGRPLSEATWGRRNTAKIAHPIASALPLVGRWLTVPPDMLPGDNNMPRVAGPNVGQSERMTVSPGKEEQGLFTMPGGQSGNPLSPFFLDGQAAWVAGEGTPLMPGPAIHTFKLVK
jgi:penicillin amidase